MTHHSDAGDHPFLSVVVPTLDRAGMLEGCLASLLDQTYPAGRYEVVVVDNGSADGTEAVVRAAADAAGGGGGAARVLYVAEPRRGVNTARNAGIAAASGDVICFVDDDELAPRAHLERLAELLRSDATALAVGGPVQGRHTSAVRTCSSCSIGDARLDQEERAYVDRLLGGNVAVRRRAFSAAGPFDPELSGRGDENEWFHRAGGPFLYDPALVLWHRTGDLGLSTLVGSHYRQGKGLVHSLAKTGGRYRPRVKRLARLLGHAATRRCSVGLVLAARELGAIAEWVRTEWGRMGWRRMRSRGRGAPER